MILKLLRVALLVLLTLLLPVRGTLAAALPCAAGSHGMAAVEAAIDAAVHAPGHDHAQGHAMPTVADEGAEVAPDTVTSTASNAACQLCASCCSVPPLRAEIPALQAPTVSSRVSFPPLSAPAPTHRSDGRARPPRPC